MIYFTTIVCVTLLIASTKRVFIRAAIVDGGGDVTPRWGYDDDDGPNTWFGDCRTGIRQSPIDIDFRFVQIDNQLPKIYFMNYDQSGIVKFDNNGHTEITSGFDSWVKRPYIYGASLLDHRYLLTQFHFHWSGDDSAGSEHTFNGLHYPLEAHFVHIREDLNETSALNTPDGIAVVAIFLAIANDGDALHDLENVFNVTIENGDEFVTSYRPNELLPHDTDGYYQYSGSLTTPNCSEVVSWILLAQPIYVLERELNELRRHDEYGNHLLSKNWRPVQPINGRPNTISTIYDKLPK